MMPSMPPPLVAPVPLQTDATDDLEARQQQQQQLMLLHSQQPIPAPVSDTHVFDEARTDSDADRDDRLVAPPLSTDHADVGAEHVSVDTANKHEANDSASNASQSAATVSPGAPSGAIFGVVLQPLETLVALPEIERREFDSWDELHAHLTEYSDRTHQVQPAADSSEASQDSRSLLTRQIYRTATSTPVSKRNAGIKPNPYTRVRQCIPETFRQYAKTIACTHAGVARHRTRGLRPERLSRCMGCPARVRPRQCFASTTPIPDTHSRSLSTR